MGGVTSGADEGLLSGLEGAVDGLASGEFEACWLFGSVQPASTKTNPATHAAGTAPLLTRPWRTLCAAKCTGAPKVSIPV